MATEIWLDKGWAEEMLKTAKEAETKGVGKAYSEKEEAILREVDAQCRANEANGTSKPVVIKDLVVGNETISLTDEQLAKEFGRMLKLDYDNASKLMQDGYGAANEAMMKRMDAYRNGLLDDYNKDRDGMSKDYENDRQKAKDGLDRLRDKIGRKPGQSASDWLNSAFSYDDTRANMKSVRQDFDNAVASLGGQDKSAQTLDPRLKQSLINKAIGGRSA